MHILEENMGDQTHNYERETLQMQNTKSTTEKCLTNKNVKFQYDKAHCRVLKGKPHKRYKQFTEKC